MGSLAADAGQGADGDVAGVHRDDRRAVALDEPLVVRADFVDHMRRGIELVDSADHLLRCHRVSVYH